MSIMTDNPINVAGIEIPSDSLVFLAALGAHVLFGLCCVSAGVVAISSSAPAVWRSAGAIGS